MSHEKEISFDTASCEMLSCLLCTRRDLDRRHFPRKANKVFILLVCEMRGEAPIYLFVEQIPCKRRRHISALRELRLEILRGISTTIWDFVVHVGQGLRHRRVLAERQYRRACTRARPRALCMHSMSQTISASISAVNNARELYLKYFRLQICVFVKETAFDALL